MPYTFRAWSGSNSHDSVIHPMPSGVLVGDAVLHAIAGEQQVADGRFTQIAPHVWWTESLSSLGDGTLGLGPASPTFNGDARLSVAFVPPLRTSAAHTGSGAGAIGVPSYPYAEALLALTLSWSESSNGSKFPVLPGWDLVTPSTSLSTGNDEGVEAGIYYCDIPGGPTPAVSFGFEGTIGWQYAVIPLARRGLPPCRLYPRSDGLGASSGRGYPRGSTQQAGRLTGPY